MTQHMTTIEYFRSLKPNSPIPPQFTVSDYLWLLERIEHLESLLPSAGIPERKPCCPYCGDPNYTEECPECKRADKLAAFFCDPHPVDVIHPEDEPDDYADLLRTQEDARH